MAMPKRKPTPRMRRAARLVANGCKSAAEALRLAGYSKAVIRNPSKVTMSQTFQETLSEMLSNENLAKTHSELLNAVTPAYVDITDISEREAKQLIKKIPGAVFQRIEMIRRKNTKSLTRIHYLTPDSQARLRAVDLAYKVTGKYNSEPEQKYVFSLGDLRQYSEKKEAEAAKERNNF
jgi:hypothetical protein